MSRRCFLLSVALGLLGTRSALADDTDDLQALLSENVITTASTSAQRASIAPATSVTLTAEDLSRFGIRTLDEAINFLSQGVIAADPLRTEPTLAASAAARILVRMLAARR